MKLKVEGVRLAFPVSTFCSTKGETLDLIEMTIEEDCKLLFRLSQPEGWTNRISTLFSDYNTDLLNRIGLPHFKQLDLDLKLSVPKENLLNETDQQFKSNELSSGTQASKSTETFKFQDDTNPNSLYFTNILRLSVDCPFSDIRQKAQKVLYLMKEKGSKIPQVAHDGPSKFIDALQCPPIDVGDYLLFTLQNENDMEVPMRTSLIDENASVNDAKKARLLSDTFFSSGRIDHTIQLMAYHPDYLDTFLRTHNFLMKGDGPLPYNYRNYIGIMAAARYQDLYLIELQKREFLFQGGDPKWLMGLNSVPPKLVSLYNINKIMAHRPWCLKKEDFLYLTKKAGWSLSEVVQALVVLVHFHALSSFIHGCGITPEIDFNKGHVYPNAGSGGNGCYEAKDMSVDTEGSGGVVVGSPHQGALGSVVVQFASETNAASSVSGNGGTAGGGGGSNNSCNGSNQGSNVGGSGGINVSSNSGGGGNGSTNMMTTVSSPHGYFGGGGGGITSSTNSGSIDALKKKPAKSILKKTDGVPGSMNTNDNHNNNSISGSTTNSNSNSTKLLKSANTMDNEISASPPKKGHLSTASEVETIVATMNKLHENTPIEDPEEKKKRFENVASSDDSHEKENLLSPCLNQAYTSLPSEVSPFVLDPDFTYEDFAKRGQMSELHTFRIQDYSWEDQGFSLVNRLYADVGGILDEKFKMIQNMTYYTMGGRAHIDTTKFRTAVWNYIQCLYGIRHDDYDYGEVNQLLERPLKSYIKTVCCYPDRVTKADYDSVMRGFRHSEKVHVNLMIMEAKLQAELLYALKSIMRFVL